MLKDPKARGSRGMNTTTTQATESPVSDALKVLDQGVANLIATDGWKNYLRVQAQFHQYSFNNTLWLMIQGLQRDVAVSRFAGFQTWKKMGRYVRAGEKSFKVLAPCGYKRTVEKEDGSKEEKFGVRGFKVASTFDISQTEGPDLPEVAHQLQGSDETARETFTRLADWSGARGVPISREVTGGSNGYYLRSDNRIAVSDNLSDIHALKTLCHEVAHSILHATDEGDSRETKEVEAESTAFVVMTALGFDTSDYSFGYVAVWSKGSKEAVRAVAGRVQKTAHEILDALSKTPLADRLDRIEAALA